MPLLATFASARPLTKTAVVLVTGALSAALLAALPDEVDAATPCSIDVNVRLDRTAKLASNGVTKYYHARAEGAEVGQYTHTGNVLMTTLPLGAYPRLINVPIGQRNEVGEMTKRQTPRAIAGINGDFFTWPDIRYRDNIEMARGPMVKEGTVIRGTADRMRVVGLTRAGQPFAGMFGVRGNIRAVLTDALSVPIQAVNWQRIPKGGVSIYTGEWSTERRPDGKPAVPRPAGEAEWVIDNTNTLVAVRTQRRRSAALGAAVENGTTVLAFSRNTADQARGVPVGTKVDVNPRQSTDTGVKLRTGVGRGLPLIVNGKAAPLGCRAYELSQAARPRTFVGWDDKGRWRTFTVPGSKLEQVNGTLLRTGGFGLASAANIAKRLGMVAAYELDGGGSTTLWTRKASDWKRRDLYGVSNPTNCTCERWMTNGLSFVLP